MANTSVPPIQDTNFTLPSIIAYLMLKFREKQHQIPSIIEDPQIRYETIGNRLTIKIPAEALISVMNGICTGLEIAPCDQTQTYDLTLLDFKLGSVTKWDKRDFDELAEKAKDEKRKEQRGLETLELILREED